MCNSISITPIQCCIIEKRIQIYCRESLLTKTPIVMHYKKIIHLL